MTNEEAIDILQEKHDECKAFYDLAAHPEDTYPSTTKYLYSLDMAIAALRPVSRERVDRMAGEWVQDINKGPAVFYCSSCGESFEIHSYEVQKYRFCPFCMAPMTDEAVKMVMGRLEALYEKTD